MIADSGVLKLKHSKARQFDTSSHSSNTRHYDNLIVSLMVQRSNRTLNGAKYYKY